MTISDHDFPFPQMHSGMYRFMLCVDRILLLDSEYQPISRFDVTSGRSWHVADFGLFVVFTNGAVVCTFDELNGFRLRNDLPQFNTCCEFNGQLFVGGFREPWQDAELNSVGWSNIGSASFELKMANMSGFMWMETSEVLRVAKLGNEIIAYGDRGVWRMPAVAEPVVGFGKRKLSQCSGIASRSAWAGNEDDHVFVDTKGQLWHIQFGQQPKLLGYEEFFRPMLRSDIVGSYNPHDRSFYFSNGEVTYRWDDYGLSKVWQGITSIWIDNGVELAYYHDIDNNGFELTTDTLDFGFRGRKTLTSLEVGGSFEQAIFASVDWRSHNEKFFRTVPWKKVSPEGFARINVTADEFRVKLMSNAQTAEIDYINVKYQITDKRNTRGSINVDTANTGSDNG